MKLIEKLFLIVVCLILVLFALFGCIILSASFQNSLEQEKERSLEETRMLQYALTSSLENLPEQYMAEGAAVGEIADSLKASMQMSDTGVVIVNGSGKQMYASAEGIEAGFLEKLTDAQRRELQEEGAWQIINRQDGHYLEAVVMITGKQDSYYLEVHRNIEVVYRNRGQLHQQYTQALLFALVIGAVVTLGISFQFTRPIRQLSQATKEFAKGDYSRRVEVKGNDELTLLMQDFNTMAEQLENNIWELEEAKRRQEEFTGAFAHELKTPLTSVIGYAGMLRSVELSEEERIMSADTIYKQGRRLERLSKKMLELVQIGKREMTFREIKVEELFAEAVLFTRQLLELRDVTLQVDVEDGSIYGDMDLLCSLLGNLIENAAKASKAGDTIELKGKPLDNAYEISVRDHGCGMKQEETGRITEAFYRIDKSRARKEGGTGLGLALCEKIVLVHKARWRIESVENAGTKIMIVFPEGRGMDA